MSKILITMSKFSSFKELSEILSQWGEEVETVSTHRDGIYIITMFDDGQRDTIQHMLTVVIGEFEKKWEVRKKVNSNGILGKNTEIITVAFEPGEVPLFANGRELLGENVGRINVHSIYAPRCHCIEIEK